MKGEFIAVEDERWKAILGLVPHDFYHLPEYLCFAGRMETGEPMAFWAEEGESLFLVPLLRRPIPSTLGAPPGWNDLVTPYGYPSPLMWGGDADLFNRFLTCFVELGREQLGISAFMRLHPLLENPAISLTPPPAVDCHGQTVFFDLEKSEEEIGRQVRENHRRDIKKLRQRGFSVVLDDWNDLDSFIAIYTASMQRLNAAPFYYFSRDYFHHLRAALPDHLHLCSVRAPDGVLSAGGLFACTGSIIEYHLGGTADEFLSSAPSKLMFDAIWRWGKENRYRVFHLGGGLGGRNDSLFRFKEGFSPDRADFFTARMILDPEKYSFLVQQWEQAANGGTAEKSDYFPAYRRPAGLRDGVLDNRPLNDID